MMKLLLAGSMVFVITAGGVTYAQPTTCPQESSTSHCVETLTSMNCRSMSGSHKHEGHRHQEQSGSAEIKAWDGMSPHMIPMMKSINEMNQKITLMMTKEMSAEKMKFVSEMMDEVADETREISEMMFKGMAAENDMHNLHMKINASLEKIKDRKN